MGRDAVGQIERAGGEDDLGQEGIAAREGVGPREAQEAHAGRTQQWVEQRQRLGGDEAGHVDGSVEQGLHGFRPAELQHPRPDFDPTRLEQLLRQAARAAARHPDRDATAPQLGQAPGPDLGSDEDPERLEEDAAQRLDARRFGRHGPALDESQIGDPAPPSGQEPQVSTDPDVARMVSSTPSRARISR